MSKLPTVVVVDDHPFFRDGLARGLTLDGRVKVLGEAGDGREAIELIEQCDPDVALVDYQLPQLDGIGVVRELARRESRTRVLLISAVTDGAVVFGALEQGAAGYITKDASRRDIIAAVLDVSGGGTVVPPDLAAGLADQIRLRSQRTGPVLSPRELEALRGFSRGLSIPQLAAEMHLAPSTVKTHVQHLYEKLGVSDRAAAVAVALRSGLVD